MDRLRNYPLFFMILRNYQRGASDAVFKEWQDVNSTLVVLPTGCGKTIVFADIIRRCFPKRAMVIAHREELIWQAKDKINRSTGLSCEVEMGNYKSAPDLFSRAAAIVSTIQTQCAGGDGGGRMGKFDPAQFGVLIIDEAHHATASTYKRIIEYYRTNPNLKIVGVTASPDRADEEALGQVFDTCAYSYEILDAISDGWLVPIEQQMVSVNGLDFSSIRTTAGDLNGADLAAVMEAEKNLHEISSSSLEIIGSKRALVFTSSVKHAQTLSEIFNRHRSGMSAWVCGKTDKDERRKILSDYAGGKIQILCNCSVLTEGFDDAGVQVIIMARPTKSRSLYSQMVGRSTRPLPGIVDGPETPELRRQAIAASAKPSCLVVDFSGNSGKHKLITSADILGGNVSDEAVQRAIAQAKKTGKPVRMSEALADEEQLIKEEAEQRRLADEARRTKLTAKASFTTQSVDPFDVLQIQPVKARGWDTGKVLTEKQRNFIQKQGLDPDSLPYSQAKQLIGAMLDRFDKKLCSFKMAKTLRKFGFNGDVSFDEAKRTIDAIAAAGWKRPAEPVKKYPPVPTRPMATTGVIDGEEPF
jgi:superfamily II DNA or RNA helicase